MEKLQTQLEYFVKTKITHDRMWQGIHVYLSGHQVCCWLLPVTEL